MPQIRKKAEPGSGKKKVKREDDCVTANENFGLLISAEYELTKGIPIHVHRYEDGVVVIDSHELNLYAQGDSDYEARRLFSEVLVGQLEDLQGFLDQGQKLGRALHTQLKMLKRLLKKVEH